MPMKLAESQLYGQIMRKSRSISGNKIYGNFIIKIGFVEILSGYARDRETETRTARRGNYKSIDPAFHHKRIS